MEIELPHISETSIETGLEIKVPHEEKKTEPSLPHEVVPTKEKQKQPNIVETSQQSIGVASKNSAMSLLSEFD
jgi:hypothetical protein